MTNNIKKITCILLAGTMIGTLSSCKKYEKIDNYYNDDLINYKAKNEDILKDSIRLSIRESFLNKYDFINDVELDEETINNLLTELNKRSVVCFNIGSYGIKKFIQNFIDSDENKNLSLIQIIDKVKHIVNVNEMSLTNVFKYKKDDNEYALYTYIISNKFECIIEEVKDKDKVFSKKIIIYNSSSRNNFFNVEEEYNLEYKDNMKVKIENSWNVNKKSLDNSTSNDFLSRIYISNAEYENNKYISNDNSNIFVQKLFEAYDNDYDFEKFISENKNMLLDIIGNRAIKKLVKKNN